MKIDYEFEYFDEGDDICIFFKRLTNQLAFKKMFVLIRKFCLKIDMIYGLK